MPYVQSWTTLENHPKLLRLVALVRAAHPLYRDLHPDLCKTVMVGHLHRLWWWALEYAADGDLTGYHPAELAAAAGWPGDPDVFVTALADCGRDDPRKPGSRRAGFLERTADGKLAIHDWWQFAGEMLRKRQQRAAAAIARSDATATAARVAAARAPAAAAPGVGPAAHPPRPTQEPAGFAGLRAYRATKGTAQ